MSANRRLVAITASLSAFVSIPAHADWRLTFQTMREVSGYQKAFVIINSQDQLVKYAATGSGRAYSMLPGPGTSARDLPKIDFTKWTLLVASLGPSTGHELGFKSIDSMNGQIYAHLYDFLPGHNCAVAQVVGYPSAAVLIAHTEVAVTFDVTAVSNDCDQRPTIVNGTTP